MHVNTTSVTEPLKVAKSGTDQSVSNETESVDFFAQLAAMLQGDVKADEIAAQGVAVEGGTATDESTAVDGELLPHAEVSQATEVVVESEQALLDSADALPIEMSSELEAIDSHDGATSSRQMSGQELESALAESEALLGRLNVANATLQDGKSLPPQELAQASAPSVTSSQPQLAQADVAQQAAVTSEEDVKATEIAWQNIAHNNPSAEAVKAGVDDELKAGMKANTAALHVSAPNQAPQAVSHQGQPVATPAALSSINMQPTPSDALIAPAQVDLASSAKLEPAQLQAALAAGSAEMLAKLNINGEQGQGSESSFAQQLSQVAGQNSLQGPLRTEQSAQTQPPLQLNREMASEQVAERVQMMLSKNLKNIDIRLDPPELGRMQIRMNMNGDSTSVHFTVANQQAREIIEQAMPRLREMLAQQGMQLSDSSVQQQASGQQQSRYSQTEQGTSQHGHGSSHFSADENLEADVKLDVNVAAKRDGISYYA